MKTGRIKRNLGTNKVIPVCALLLWGFILASGRELRVQEGVDLSSKPEPNYVASDAQVIPAQPLTFGERIKIYERSSPIVERRLAYLRRILAGYSRRASPS